MKTIFLILVFAFAAAAQTDEPRNICLTQTEANKAAAAIDEAKALRDELKALRDANAAKDAAIQELKTDLKVSTQRVIDLEADKIEQRAIIQFLLTNGRKKIKIGLINF
jgi:septal ring factor EnvC (AmiA/AmiB activator)